MSSAKRSMSQQSHLIICLFLFCVSGMERGPVLRFWTHWSQSCCWRKAQTRSHSRGVCKTVSVTALWWCNINLTLHFASLSRYDPSMWWCIHQCWLNLAAALLTFWPLPSLHTLLHKMTTLPLLLLPLWAATYSTPRPNSSATVTTAYSLCHNIVNSLSRYIICET